jgi:hypothetical protein
MRWREDPRASPQIFNTKARRHEGIANQSASMKFVKLISWSAASDMIPKNRSTFRSFTAVQDDSHFKQ